MSPISHDRGPAAAVLVAGLAVLSWSSQDAGPPRDLGTLGGNWSRAQGINGHGWVVGASQVPPGRLHAVSGHAFLWRDGRMEDLGTLGGTESSARDVNDAGQVVGVAEADSGRGPRRFPPRPGRRELVEIFERAFLWEDGRMQDLGTLGGRTSEAHAISERGWVVGASQVDPGRLHDVSRHAFLWRDGRMEDLGTLGGAGSVAHDVSDDGLVVGASQTAPDRSGRIGVHAFVWENGRMRDLGTLGGRESRAYGVNEEGQVVGAGTTGDGHVRAFLWEEGELRELGTLGGDDSRAYAIDDDGRIVGSSSTADGEVHAFVWEDGEMRRLGALDGSSQARAVSAGAGVAGTSRTARGRDGSVAVHAVLWEPPAAAQRRKRFLSTKATLAGRSASRRMYQGNHSSP